MRSTGSLATLDALGPRDHVCWVVGPADDYDAHAVECVRAGADAGDKVFLFGPRHTLTGRTFPAYVGLADPFVDVLRQRFDAADMFAMFERESAVARADGHRALRVVADMDWLHAGPVPTEDVLAFELLLDRAVDELDATVVCAYRTGSFGGDAVFQVLAAHPLDYGALPSDPGFRMWSDGGVWHVSGDVELVNAEVFAAALDTAASAARGDVLWLRLDQLSFIDVQGMRAIARVAQQAPDLRLVLDGARPAFRRCWTLLGYARELPAVRWTE